MYRMIITSVFYVILTKIHHTWSRLCGHFPASCVKK